MEGIPLAVLTNGGTWWLYLPLQQASWEQRKYDSLEMNRENSQIFSEKIIDYLSRENVSSEKAVENAIQAYRDSSARAC